MSYELQKKGKECFFVHASLQISFLDPITHQCIKLHFFIDSRVKTYLEGIKYEELSPKQIQKIAQLKDGKEQVKLEHTKLEQGTQEQGTSEHIKPLQ